jgi:outer membrane scaffolding protein for murein synthesis (MipA/OmpV family)
MSIRRGLLLTLLLISIVFPKAAISAEKPLWELGVGFSVLLLPDYRGSDEYRVYPLPYPHFIYRGDVLKVDENKISGQIFKTNRILLDVSIYGYLPVKSSSNTAREGMPDLDPTFEIGPAIKINLLESKEDKYRLSLAMPVRAVFSTDFSSVRYEGWVFSPRINFEKDDIIPKTGLNLGISAGPMFADSGYHEYFYTVESEYATVARPAYCASGGYSGSTLSIGLSKEYKQFIFSTFVSADFLQGAVFENSPLVKIDTSIMTGISLTWVFFKSAKMVTTDK